MWSLLNKRSNGMFERVTLTAVDEVSLPCDHLIGEYGPAGLRCADCHASLGPETTPPHPKCDQCGRFCRQVGDGWRCPQVFFDDYSGTWEHA
jgi:hypothetical protein